MQHVMDALVSGRVLRERLGGISHMTLKRWTVAKILPPPVKINGRNYWRESDVAAVQEGRVARKVAAP